MSSNVNFKSYVKHYWITWFIIDLILVISEIISTDESSDFYLYAVFVWIPIMIINFVEQRRLLSYVEQYHDYSWRQLRTKEGEMRAHLLLYFSDSIAFDDSEVVARKINYKSFVKLLLVAFFAFPVLSIVTFLL